MTKFTPGPLTIHGPSPGGTSYDDGGDYAIRDPKGHIIGEAICFVESSYTPMPAEDNARLWAASPNMLEALNNAVSNCPTCGGISIIPGKETWGEAAWGYSVPDDPCPTCNSWRVAIELATRR